MKKVLILTGMKNGRPFTGSNHEADMLAGCERLSANTKEMQWFAAAINDIAIVVTGGKVTAYDIRHNCPLTDYAFIQFRNVSFARDHFKAAALFTEHEGIPYVDSEDVAGTPFGKISQMVLFALQGIPVPDTLAVWSGAGFKKLAEDMVTPPFICKANNGIRGNRNFLIKDWEEFDSLLEAQGHEGYVVQPFIPNEGDYRVLCIGTERLIFFRRRAADTHLNNTSQNGSGERITEDECDPGVLKLAEQAMSIYGRSIGGVDVLQNAHTNEAYILEINDTPALLTGLFQDEKSKLYATFVEQQLRPMKEKK